MANENYHYPSPEEIRVGWQGEINWNLGYEDTYIPLTILYPDEEARDGWNCNIDDVLSLAIWDGCAEVRVPFLSEEQILAEGWTYRKVFDCFEKGNWTVKLVPFSKRVIFSSGEFSTFGIKCPDINTFRYLCNLLEIDERSDI